MITKKQPFHICSVSLRFGAITMISGIIGVPLGTFLTQKLKKKSHRNDPIVCACGLFISAPLLAGGMILITENELIAYALVFIGEIALNLNWAIVADILLVRSCVHFNFEYSPFLLFLLSRSRSLLRYLFGSIFGKKKHLILCLVLYYVVSSNYFCVKFFCIFSVCSKILQKRKHIASPLIVVNNDRRKRINSQTKQIVTKNAHRYLVFVHFYFDWWMVPMFSLLSFSK